MNGLKILVTNHQLMEYSGSDVFTSVLVDFLKRRGHSVTLYSKYLGKVASSLASNGIRIVDDLADISNEPFDVAHVHHNINAVEVRFHFPDIPILFLSHGVLPFLEKPPRLNTNISSFIAVSEEVRDQLILFGAHPDKVNIFRNIIDSTKFHQFEAIGRKPSRALILSNKIDKECEEVILAACDDLDISCKFAGQQYGVVEQDFLPLEMNKADIVFSLGRGVMEAMLCGRIPIVFDYQGGDGIVTPDNFCELKKSNFSGRRYRKRFTVSDLKEEIRKYDAKSANILRSLAFEEYDADHRIDDLIDMYRSSIERHLGSENPKPHFELLEDFVFSVRETRQFKDAIRDKAVAQAQDQYLENLRSGRGWRLLLKYYGLRDQVFSKLKLKWGAKC